MRRHVSSSSFLAGCFILVTGLFLGITIEMFWASPAQTEANEKGNSTTGDVNGDGNIDLSDAVSILIYLFGDGEEPAPCPATTFEPPRHIFIVRHAEKDSTPGNDQPLTEEGKARAQYLAMIFQKQKVDAIYASKKLRTYQTVEPLAEMKGLEIQRFNNSTSSELNEINLLTESLHSLPAGAVAVVAGHSYSIGRILEGLGIENPPSINGYDDFFEVSLPADEKSEPSFLYLSY